jgi:FAD:protein FMN transferase
MFGLLRESQLRSSKESGPSTGAHPVADGGWMQREEAIMGTAIRVDLWSDDPYTGNQAINAVMQEMHRIDHAMSPYKSASELSLINRDAEKNAVPVSAEMFSLLERAQAFSVMSKGAFDLSYAAVGRLYDYRLGTGPTATELKAARQAVGYRHIVLDSERQTVRFAKPGMCIDLGGFAKGYAVDNATEILHGFGIKHANVSAGGDSRAIGDRRGRPWSIGVRDPRNPDNIIAVLPLEDTSISTSGDYERYFEKNGARFHHLIDPATGESPHHVRSVTILGDDGLTTEAFSKCVFVLGVEKGLRLIESYAGLDAIIVDARGALHYSSGFLDPSRPIPLSA